MLGLQLCLSVLGEMRIGWSSKNSKSVNKFGTKVELFKMISWFNVLYKGKFSNFICNSKNIQQRGCYRKRYGISKMKITFY